MIGGQPLRVTDLNVNNVKDENGRLKQLAWMKQREERRSCEMEVEFTYFSDLN